MFVVPQSHKENLWEHNPHLQILNPYSQLYNNDTSKNKTQSSNLLWCIIWLCHPDEDLNKFYRLPYDEKISHCTSFESSFNIDDPTIKECIDIFPKSCLTLIQAAYKEDKDQLYKISAFLNKLDLTLETIQDVIKLKAQMPKIYADFAKTDKEFERNKSTQRVHGGRTKTLRERGVLQPDE